MPVIDILISLVLHISVPPLHITVRSTKRLLISVIGAHIYAHEEFTTVLVLIEAMLNFKTLTTY